MIKRGIKRGFTLVELLIVVAILALLSGAAYVGIQRSQTRVMNEKVMDDLAAIVNALEQYKQDAGNYPNIEPGPLELGEDKNVNCFKADTTYSHDCTEAGEAAFIQTQVDNILLTKRYLQEVPTDPRTQSRYMYGVTTDGQFFQVAGNYLMDDGTYVAKVRGNVKMGYRLPSLIRAFDGRNFVMEGESFLPYSPDHLSLTIKVEVESGPILDYYNEEIHDGDTLEPGSWVNSGTGASAILYFSDGSITYLDENTQIYVLPNTEVMQNDEDGIITKIRLKLFQGKIWSKVARLAKESEFNVETTSAIAGVRGTEFGMEVGKDEIIILSGKVAVRKMNSDEKESALETDGFVDFSSATSAGDFLPLQEVTGDGINFQTFSLPDHNINAAPDIIPTLPQTVTEIKAKFYKGPFNNNYRPRILEIDTTIANSESIVFEYLAGVTKITLTDEKGDYLESWIGNGIGVDAEKTLTIGLTAFLGTQPQGTLAKFYFEDNDGSTTGFTSPDVFIAPSIQLTEDDIYNLYVQKVEVTGCAGALQTIQVTGPDLVVAGSSGNKYEAEGTFTVPPNCTTDVTSQCTWEVIGGIGSMVDNDLTVGPTPGMGKVQCGILLIQEKSPQIEVLSKAKAYCLGPDLHLDAPPLSVDDQGVWDDPACWVLGDPATNCTDTCNSKVNATCAPGDWDDMPGNTICKALVPTALVPFDAGPLIEFAPHFYPTLNRCYTRNVGANPTPDLCLTIGTNPNVMTVHQRVCKCI